MTPSFTLGLVWVLIIITVFDIALAFGLVSDAFREHWRFVYHPVAGVLCFVIAVGLLIQNERVLTAMYTFSAVVHLRRWWFDERNRRKRKRLLDRAAGVVRDMGGRLKVVRPVES